jgi:hypothetical protein
VDLPLCILLLIAQVVLVYDVGVFKLAVRFVVEARFARVVFLLQFGSPFLFVALLVVYQVHCLFQRVDQHQFFIVHLVVIGKQATLKSLHSCSFVQKLLQTSVKLFLYDLHHC